jgi:hypothetical protein
MSGEFQLYGELPAVMRFVNFECLQALPCNEGRGLDRVTTVCAPRGPTCNGAIPAVMRSLSLKHVREFQRVVVLFLQSCALNFSMPGEFYAGTCSPKLTICLC